ncbi:hypothetical protein JCM8097_002584 [Rhodosporidiobolus ruineniae]
MAAASSSKSKSSKSAPPPKKKTRRIALSSDNEASDDEGSEVGGSSDEDDASEDEVSTKKRAKKPKAPAKGKGKAADKPAPKKKKAASTSKAKGKKRKADEDDFVVEDGSEEEGDEDDEDSEGGLNTRVVREMKKQVDAPREKAETHVILQSTLDFLAQLAKNNDREWFQEHGHAFLNFKTFVTAWVPKATEADWSLPHLPAKDLVQRIYRDVRFSKDKTPYKLSFSASTSRTGRKGPYALYYIHIQPGDRSHLGVGCWGAGSTELKLIRNQILRDSKPLRKQLAKPDFVELFGEPKPRMDKKRTSIFGWENELKTAPKLEGVDKTHKDIDLLKIRSFAVSTDFTDEVVTSPDFIDVLCQAMSVAAPFAQMLNDIISPPETDEDDATGGGGGSDEEGGEDEEDEEE